MSWILAERANPIELSAKLTGASRNSTRQGA